jgi:pantoate--beta-alanine ligase
LFGRKDYQQLAVIRRMTTDLNIPVDIIGMPIVRETDGLAISSRNAYLSAAERKSALCLHRGLEAARQEYVRGERAPARIIDIISAAIAAEETVVVDYITVCDGDTLESVSCAADNTLVAVAIRVGKTRLIDNCILGEG